MSTYNDVEAIKVSPGIGVARVGNSQPAKDGDRGFFYLGPEVPNSTVHPPQGPYKDGMGRILRQAQRFKVFAYGKEGKLLGEIVEGDTVNGSAVSIQWTADVRNMKSANYSFQGQYGFNPDNYRNSTIAPATPGTDPAARESLIIHPGPKSIGGVSQGPVELIGPGSEIFNVPPGVLPGILRFDPPVNIETSETVPVEYTPVKPSLGKLYTDADGRLIVVGAEGAAGSTTTPAVVISKISQEPPPADPQYNGNSYFNNPGWYDDTGGGRIDAAVVDQSDPGKALFTTEGKPESTGWVVVGPPKYAPTAYNIVSILDLQIDLFPEQDPYTGAGPVYYAITVGNKPYIAQSSAPGKESFGFESASGSGAITEQAGALAFFKGQVYYAITGTDGFPYLAASADGAAGSFAFRQAQPAAAETPKTDLPPSLAVLNGKLFYAITGKDSQPYIASSADGSPGSFKFAAAGPPQGVSTELAPALTAFNGKLFYALTDTKQQPNIGSSTDGSAGSFTFAAAGAKPLATPMAPSLTAFAGRLYYAITSADKRPELASSVDGSAESFAFEPVGPAAEPSASAPALSAFNGRLYYAITGTDQKPYIGSTPGGETPSLEFQPATGAATATAFAPALATRQPVNFYRDIYPFFKIATDYAWTSGLAYHGHRPGSQGDFLRKPFLDLLACPTQDGADARNFVFRLIRPPGEPTPSVPPPPQKAPENVKTSEVQRGDLMPRLTGNGGSVTENTVNQTNFPNQWLSLTNHQLSKIERWVNGDFVPGSLGEMRWSDLPPDRALDFAALQPTVGGGFHPGIELTYLVQEAGFFEDAFRFAAGTVPGSIAGYMSIPWQGDFWSCNTTFWPAARPDISIHRDAKQKLLEPRPWFRGSTIPPQSDTISGYNDGYRTMANDWPRYGFVVPAKEGPDQGEQVFQEKERDPSLDLASVVVTVAARFKETGDALAASSGTVVSQPVNASSDSQHWILVPASISPSLFLLASAATDGKTVLTANGAPVTLAAKASPYEDSQLWQYVPSGYPGVFYLESRLNGEVLSVEGVAVRTAPQGTGSLIQLFRLETATL